MLCPLCRSNIIKKIDTYSSAGYNIYNCLSCDGIFADPMKSHGREWYETSEWYSLPSEISECLRWYEVTFLKEDILSGDKMVLNIGCGRNIFLKKLKETGCNITAVDINEKIVDFTKNILGIEDVYTYEILNFLRDYIGKRFDIIIFFEVLEHLEKPQELIKNIKNVLTAKGNIVLSVPNRERIMPFRHIWDYPPHHLTRWSSISIKNFLEYNGYLLEKLIISPLTAEDLLSVFKIYFGTKYLDERIRKGDKRLIVTLTFKVLFKFRVIFYNMLAIIIRFFIKTKGLNIYAVARIKTL